MNFFEILEKVGHGPPCFTAVSSISVDLIIFNVFNSYHYGK